ncbi:N-acetylmuramoyl-L-alanine amidase [uncultured Xanthomonas sp.]|uniref:N-acetylmuramoyl-L-alanine amidase n=1 Tax=uncultured Xanthomonas sp. TaxID=152831 RepID=UPI0025E7CF65|nr:N-acetylmuramoyl-L-alanine amidase [uncultured Xanthomonas sp.]
MSRTVVLSLSLSLLLAGCSSLRSPPQTPATAAPSPPTLLDRGSYDVSVQTPSLAQNERVRFIVLHYTALNDARSLKVLSGPDVSAHYLVPARPALVDGKPVVLQLVAEQKRAWHAGVSAWNGRSNLNDTSIGVEIVNLGFAQGKAGNRQWYAFAPEQVAALVPLLNDLITRYGIAPQNVLGHSDVAPLRKYDPGPLFPWEMLARHGIGAWPDQANVRRYLAGRDPNAPGDVLALQRALKRYGYNEVSVDGRWSGKLQRIVAAFQMHFRPRKTSGIIDAETESIANALVVQYVDPAW